MVIVVSLIATLTTFFYKNVNVDNISKDTTQYTKFSSIFSEEINRKDNSVVKCKELSKELSNETSYIIFSSGNQYTFNKNSKSIYKNNIKICEDIEECGFSYTFVDSKYKITVSFKSGSIDMTGNNAVTYSL